MVVVEAINFLFSLVLVSLNFSMFQALSKYKKLRSKEENLFLEKTLFTAICFSYFLLLSVFMILGVCKNDRSVILYQIQEYIFNTYILSIYIINCFISFEMYCTYKNPIHYYLIIFNKKSRKIYEIILLIIVVLFLGLNLLDPLNDKESLEIKDENSKNYTTPFLLLDKLKWIILLATSIGSLYFIIRLYFLISKFDFDKKDKLKKIIKKKLYSNICYIVYAFYQLLIFGYMKEKDKIEYIDNLVTIIIGSFLINLILIFDTVLDLFFLSTTKFSQYKLRKTLVGFFSHVFPNDFGDEHIDVIDSIKIPDMNSNSDEENEDDDEEEKEDSENESEVSLIPKSPADTELVSIYKNNIYFEDYFMSFCDQYLNLLSASLFKIYNSKVFSIKSVEAKKIKEEMGGISISGIGGINASNTAEMSASAHETENGQTYTLHKNNKKNNFALFSNILGQTKENIKVKITSYYTDNCVMNIKKLNLISKKIASSMISHFIVTAKKEDKDNPNNFWSLISANAKEEYFRNMKNITFKSYDKNFNFDFFETDDGEISENNKTNKDIAKMIEQYFDYIQEGKGKTGTFLPELIGIFKIKINNFDTMLLYVSRNTLVQNIPKNFFTYWQLLRFDKIKPYKIASSKFHGSTLVEDDPLFERPYSVQAKNEKDDINKVLLNNYNDFKEIIENDIEFLKSNNLLYVNLLMMYFEYENTQKHEKEGAIQIRKTVSNKAEIINIDLPENKKEEKKEEKKEDKIEKIEEKEDKEKEADEEDNLKLDSGAEFGETNINTNENEKISDDMFGDENGKEGDIFGDEGFDFMPDVGKQAHNLLDYSEKVSITGYEGNFDNFICMCFFTFENAFDLNNKTGTRPDDEFKNKIMEKFAQFKSKE